MPSSVQDGQRSVQGEANFKLLNFSLLRGEQGKQGARDVVPGKQQREGWIMSYEKGPTKTKKHSILAGL